MHRRCNTKCYTCQEKHQIYFSFIVLRALTGIYGKEINSHVLCMICTLLIFIATDQLCNIVNVIPYNLLQKYSQQNLTETFHYQLST